MCNKCSWRIPGLFKDVDPNRVKDELDYLGDNVKPEDVVEFAQNSDTELHKCFEWDDTEAARMYRLSQARKVLRSLVVEVTSEKKETSYIRVRYVTNSNEGYKPVKLVFSDKGEYKALLDRAKKELKSFREKYKSLTELQELFDVIDSIDDI